MSSVQSALGILVFVALAWLLGENRRAARLKVALAGIAAQLGVAALVLWVPHVSRVFEVFNDAVLVLQKASEAGTSMVFGYLGGGALPFEIKPATSSFIFAFRALPLIIVVSALTAVLTYHRVLPWIVRAFSVALQKAFGIGGAVGLGTAANIFVGMVEAPLLVRPYLARMTRSELFTLMCAGMATIAGTVLVLYSQILQDILPNAAGHLLVSSIISAPAAVTIALLMVPETQTHATEIEMPERGADSTMDAITRGTRNGLEIFLTVIATMIVLVALVALVNALLAFLPNVGGEPLALERLLGWVMAPVTWLMGIPWSEAQTAGALMGTKTVLNELLAYIQMSQLPPEALSPRSQLIMAYALCSFANFGSLGIMMGGLSAMIPERRKEITALGMKSLVGGTLATCCTGAVVGIF